MPAKPEELDEMISIRVSDADVKALEALVDRLPMKKITIARVSLRIGLEALDRDPSIVLRGATRRRKASGRGGP